MKELLEEKADWERKIALRESEVKQATHDIYYLKKHLKITEWRIREMEKDENTKPKTDGETLGEIAEGIK
jgi:phage shock protein A